MKKMRSNNLSWNRLAAPSLLLVFGVHLLGSSHATFPFTPEQKISQTKTKSSTPSATAFFEKKTTTRSSSVVDEDTPRSTRNSIEILENDSTRDGRKVFAPDPHPRAGATYTIVGKPGTQGPQLRVTVLSQGLMRLQYAEDNVDEFHDQPTLCCW